MILRVGLFPYIFILFASLTAGLANFFDGKSLVSEDLRRAEPELRGPGEVCILQNGFTYSEYFAGGDPTDIFNWFITDAEGNEVFTLVGRTGESRIIFPFSLPGNYLVEVTVYRNGDQNYYHGSMPVVVEEMANQPQLTAPLDVLLCGSETETVFAISEESAASGQYCIEWREDNQDGRLLSNENSLEISEEGTYYVAVWLGDCATAACKVEGWTTAGPPIEFEVIPSASEVCLGQRVSYTPDSPISGTWFYQKAGQSSRTPLGKSFTLDLNTNDLEGTGEYSIFFSTEGENSSACTVEKGPFRLQVNEGLEFTVAKLSDATDCDATDGGFRITAGSDLDQVTVEGVPGATYSGVSAGQQIEVSGLVPKLYVIRGRRNDCSVTRTVNIENENFTAPITVTATVMEEGSCTASGIEGGVVSLSFSGGSGEYTIISSNGRTITGSFTAGQTIEQDLAGGRYQLQISDTENCTSPNVQSFTIPSARQVSYSVPPTPTGCEFFEFIPESEQDLEYTLTDASGNSIPWNADRGFRIETSGTYTLLGQATDPSLGLCPRQRQMEVTINEKIEFEPVSRYIDCYGNQIFTAQLEGGLRTSDVVIRWRDSDNEIVGREVEFFPPWPGQFTLDVQPRRSSSCQTAPKSFIVESPDWATSVSIDATPYCGDDAFSTLTAEYPGNSEVFIQWFHTDSTGTETELLDFKNTAEIDVTDDGMYRAVIRRVGGQGEPDCELGQASYTLEKMDPISLDRVAGEYQICTAENLMPTVSAGQFATYSWVALAEDGSETEVSTLATFRLDRGGDYRLEVTDVNGCQASAEFTVIDKCQTLARYPNAIVPGNPAKDFKVFVDPMVEDMEVFVYNRLGELVYHCKTTVQDPSQPFCTWDGLVAGEKAPIGTYPMLIRLNSQEYEIHEEIKASIFVVE